MALEGMTYFCTCCNNIVSPMQYEHTRRTNDLKQIDVRMARCIRILNIHDFVTFDFYWGDAEDDKRNHCVPHTAPYITFDDNVILSNSVINALPIGWEVADPHVDLQRVAQRINIDDSVHTIYKMIRECSRYTIQMIDKDFKTVGEYLKFYDQGLMDITDWAYDITTNAHRCEEDEEE